MPRYRPSIVASVVLTTIVGLVGCAGTGEFAEPVPQQDREIVASTPQSASVEAVRPDEGNRPSPRNFIARNYNLTIMVADPGKALDAARAIVAKAGGDINNADQGGEAASLNARLSRGTSERVFQALRTLGKITNESQGLNDMRTAMHDLRAKLRRLELATVTLQQSIRRADDPAEVDALVMLVGLAQREKDSHRQQIASYETQARGDQLYVSFQMLPPTLGGQRLGGKPR